MQKDLITKISVQLLSLAPQINDIIIKSFNDFKTKKTTEYEIENDLQDAVSQTDRIIGELLIDKVYKLYPEELSIDSEESTERIVKGPITLRFDPIDGTKHLIKGIPLLASCMTLSIEDDTEFALVIDVFAHNCYHAYKSGGAFLNNKKIVTGANKLSDSLSFVLIESPNSKLFEKDSPKFVFYMKKFEELLKTSYRTRNVGNGSLSICYVADGSSPAYIDFSATTKLYDIEAAVLIAKEAGCMIGTIGENNLNPLTFDETSDKKKLTESVYIANPQAGKELMAIFG